MSKITKGVVAKRSRMQKAINLYNGKWDHLESSSFSLPHQFFDESLESGNSGAKPIMFEGPAYSKAGEMGDG